ncbi:MAG: phosphohistidine phosphatase SixA [Gammaproteobacteria bacterium]|nr:phosphohistidine phosphatase SixA [Gammaproteobacteria bacterium]
MAHLLIMRHGDAEPSAVSDEIRPLSARGRSEVQEVGRALVAHLGIDKIVASPLVRAQETASLVAACYSHEIQRDTCVSLSPNGIPDQVIAEFDGGVGSVLLVTHMPLIADLVSAISGKRQAVQTAELFCFDMEMKAPLRPQMFNLQPSRL